MERRICRFPGDFMRMAVRWALLALVYAAAPISTWGDASHGRSAFVSAFSDSAVLDVGHVPPIAAVRLDDEVTVAVDGKLDDAV